MRRRDLVPLHEFLGEHLARFQARGRICSARKYAIRGARIHPRSPAPAAAPDRRSSHPALARWRRAPCHRAISSPRRRTPPSSPPAARGRCPRFPARRPSARCAADCSNFQTIACSRPPLPNTSAFIHGYHKRLPMEPLLSPALPGFRAAPRINLRRLLAFAGPGFLVAVGYMDPGNWATDLAAGSRFNYTLLSVIFISNLLAILLQSLALKLGIVTGRDLAQMCRERYSRPREHAALDRRRDRHRRLRPRRGHRLRHRPAIALSHSPAARRHHHRRRRAAHPAAAASQLPHRRSPRHRPDRPGRRLLWPSRSGIRIRNGCPCCTTCFVPSPRDPAQPRDALHLHRHPRRDRDAPQPVSAFLDHPDQAVREERRRQAPGHPHGQHRLRLRPHPRPLRECRHP